MARLTHVFTVLASLTLVLACKNSTSKTDSALGLEAGKRLKSIDGAPTFIAVSNWFERFETNQSGTKKAAKYANSAKAIKSRTPAKQQSGLIAYIDKELNRTKSFRAAIAAKDRAKIGGLLTAEANEVYDIIMVMLRPKVYAPKYGDLFAVFIREDSLKNGNSFLDKFAQDFLVDVSAHIGSFAVIANDLELERVEFEKALKKEFLDSADGLNRLSTDLDSVEKSFTALRAALLNQGGAQIYSIAGAPSAFLHYQTAVYGSNKVTADDGGVKPPDDSGGGGTPVDPNKKKSDAAPDDSFLDDEPTPPSNGGGGGGQNPNQDPNGGGGGGQCPGGSHFEQCSDGTPACVPDGYTCGGTQSTYGASISPQWFKATASSGDLPPAALPTLDCATMNLTPEGRIVCERYGSYANISFQKNRDIGGGQYDGNSVEVSDLEAALKKFAGKSATFIPRFYETAVQDQGQEGACTAYGMTHTVEAVINKLGEMDGFVSSADKFWRSYGKATLTDSANSALQYSFTGSNGKTAKVSSINAIKSITELLTKLEDGPLWGASGVNDGWMNVGKGSDAKVPCGDKAGAGHAYSVHGFKINKEGTDGDLLIKNSWGTDYGAKGFMRIPLKCLTEFQNFPFHAFQIVTTAN